MPSIQFDLYVDAYADFAECPIWYAGGVTFAASSPVSFTGCSAELEIWATGAQSPFLTISTTPSGSGSIVLGPATGSTGTVPEGGIQINLSRSVTGTFAPKTQYQYALTVTFPGGFVQQVADGNVYVNPLGVH